VKKFKLLVLVAVIAGIAMAVWRSAVPETGIVVPLVPGPPQPKVSPGEAGLDPLAIKAAVDFAGTHGSQALVIGRGGHIVFEKYWGDTTLDTPLPPGDLASVLSPLLIGTAMNDRLIVNLDEPVSNYLPEYAGTATGQASLRGHLGRGVTNAEPPSGEVMALVLERVIKQPYVTQISERLWKPIGGGEFSVSREGVGARISDWMRIGELLANDGVFAGNQFTPPRFVSLMLKPSHQGSSRGFGVNVGGSFAATDLAWLADGPDRLWIVPSLRLVIMRVGGDANPADGWDEAMIPDSIIRGTSGWKPKAVGEGVDPGKFAPH
jgi:CubicO group peptidase (beta-lactamase class C family)